MTTIIWLVFGGAILYFFGVVPFRRALDDTRDVRQAAKAARQAAKAALADLSPEDAKEELKVQRAEAKAARMTTHAARRDAADERRNMKHHARSVRRNYYWTCFWAGRWGADRDRRFREAYPTPQARRAARRKGWGFPS